MSTDAIVPFKFWKMLWNYRGKDSNWNVQSCFIAVQYKYLEGPQKYEHYHNQCFLYDYERTAWANFNFLKFWIISFRPDPIYYNLNFTEDLCFLTSQNNRLANYTSLLNIGTNLFLLLSIYLQSKKLFVSFIFLMNTINDSDKSIFKFQSLLCLCSAVKKARLWFCSETVKLALFLALNLVLGPCTSDRVMPHFLNEIGRLSLFSGVTCWFFIFYWTDRYVIYVSTK